VASAETPGPFAIDLTAVSPFLGISDSVVPVAPGPTVLPDHTLMRTGGLVGSTTAPTMPTPSALLHAARDAAAEAPI